DTGAMYRAITWLALQKQVDLQDPVALAELTVGVQIDLEPLVDPETPVRIRINGEDVTAAIRTQAVTQSVSLVAACAPVREYLVKQQQSLGSQGGVVLEGRDIGTHVFPQAQVKIFLTASVQERAKRRQRQLQEQGEDISLSDLSAQIADRDYKDSHRAIAPLRQAPDAIVISTDHLTIPQVVQQIVELYRQKTVR
ncbi:MAG: (d)CMP kinase, partial [Thermostichales cyanobacterium SRBZ-1_bins_19]